MRRDLNMRRGKEIAQGAHAALGLGEQNRAIITKQIRSLDELMEIKNIAVANGLAHFIVRDAGKTEVKKGTATCIAVAGAPSEDLFRDYKLY